MNEKANKSNTNSLKIQMTPRKDKPHSTRPSTSSKRLKKEIPLTPPKTKQTSPTPNDSNIDADNKTQNKSESTGKKRVPMKRNHSQVNVSSNFFDLSQTSSIEKNDEFEKQIQTIHDNLSPGVAIGRDGKTPISSSFAKHKYKDMLTTYELSEINDYPEIYFIGNSIAKKTTKGSFDQENTFQYNAKVGDHVAYRYEILSILGKGAFGTVLKCLDHKTNDKVAIKVLVNTPVMKNQGQIEVDNMKLLTLNSISEERRSKDLPVRMVYSTPQSKTKSKRSSSIDDGLSPPKIMKNEFPMVESQPNNLSMKHVIKMTDNFIFRNHICIVTEILGESIYDFMKRRTKSKTPRSKPLPKSPLNSSKSSSQPPQPQQPEQLDPLPPQLVKMIAYQIMDGLAAIHRKKIIHGDLKPENILFTIPDSTSPIKKSLNSKSKATSKLSTKASSPFSSPYQSPRTMSHFNTSFSVIDNLNINTQIKIIDFGSSCRQGELIYNYIQSRFYRAPEVVLGAYYGPGIDVWSAGCIIAELFVGSPLFPATSEIDLLSRFIETLGTPPTSVIQMQSDFIAKVTKNAKNKTTTTTTTNKQKSSNNAPRNKFFAEDGRLLNVANQPVPMKTRLSSFLKSSDALMIDFLSKCLEWDKDKRLSAAKLCKHPWISNFTAQKI